MTVVAQKPAVSRTRSPSAPEVGAYAGTRIPHSYAGGFACRWCFGARDDFRHWLDPADQAYEDELITKRCNALPTGGQRGEELVPRGHS